MNYDHPAFPVPNAPFHGMSKREYAAVLILAGLAQATPEGLLPSVEDAVRLTDRLFKKLDTPSVDSDLPALLKRQAE